MRRSLPSGRHRLTHEEVAENQRRRLIGAMAESVASQGYAATTVAQVIARAGISRGTFYEHFENRRACLLAAHRAIFQRFLGRISEACEKEAAWEGKAAAAIGVAIEFAVAYPEETHLLALDAMAADSEVARNGLSSTERLAKMLRSGRERRQAGGDLPEVTEQALVGAVASTVNWRLLRGESLAGLEPQLIQLVLTPYVGAAAARRWASARS